MLGVQGVVSFNQFMEFGPVDKPGHCHWCGRKLRPRWRTEYPPTVKTWFEGDKHCSGRAVESRLVKPVKVGEPKFGDYSDGHFCGLRCGYMFGRRLADLGNRLVEAKKKGPTP